MKTQKIGALSGKFDPVTKVHIEFIKKAAKAVDLLYVMLAQWDDMGTFFNPIERQEMMQNELRANNINNAQVIHAHNQEMMFVMKTLGVDVFFRGVRNKEDIEIENDYFNNFHEAFEEFGISFALIKTRDMEYISSTNVKKLLSNEFDFECSSPLDNTVFNFFSFSLQLDNLVPHHVKMALMKKCEALKAK